MKKETEVKNLKPVDHVPVKLNLILSPFMKRIAKKVSLENGNNENNQSTINHGVQCLILGYAMSKKINTKLLYPEIKHGKVICTRRV